ncbi:MAG: cellulose binding domain-containing protein, partial [Candidatus Nanopelagicales bacterium]
MVTGLLCAGAALGIAPATVAAAETVTAVVQPSSTWATGWCGAIVVRNSGAAAVHPATVSAILPAGAALRNAWNATAAMSGSRVTLTLPSWARAPAAGAYSSSGFCLDGSSAAPTGCRAMRRACLR